MALNALFGALPTASRDTPHMSVAYLYYIVRYCLFYLDLGVVPTLPPRQIIQENAIRVIAENATAMVKAVAPVFECMAYARMSERAWLSTSYTDDEHTAAAFVDEGSLAYLLQEVSNEANKNTNTILVSIYDVARYPAVAAKAVNAGNAASLIYPLIYHSNRQVSFAACKALATLASHRDLLEKIEASGVLDDLLAVLRSFETPEIKAARFNDEHVDARLRLTHKDHVLPVRLCGALMLGRFCMLAMELSNNQSNPENVFKDRLLRHNVVESLREPAYDADPFVYAAAAKAMKIMGAPLMYYRDPSRKDAENCVNDDDMSHKSMPEWSIDEVCAWVGWQPFRMHRQLFREGLVSGLILSCLSDDDLKEMGISNGLHRKAVRAAVGAHLASFGLPYHHGVNARDTANSTAPTHAANIPLSPGSTSRGGGAGPAGRLELGTLARVNSFPGAAAPMSVEGRNGGGIVRSARTTRSQVDVFISYRRDGGSIMARLLQQLLRGHGWCVFLDVENLGHGMFDAALHAQMAVSHNVIVVLSPHALDRCLSDHENKDFVRKEIAQALKMGKNIVPLEGHDMPALEAFPEDMRAFPMINAVPWHHTFFQASMTMLIGFLKRPEKR